MNLTALSAFAGAYPGAVQTLQLKAQTIQQNQLALDQQKRNLAAQAAIFMGGAQQPTGPQAAPQAPQPAPAPQIQPYSLLSQQPQQTGQPPMPGQASVPMQQPQAASAAPQAPLQADAQQSGTQQPGLQYGPDGSDLSIQGQLQLIQQIAQGIKARNPSIDGPTLYAAVQQQIALLGSLSQTQKQQVIYTMDQMKLQTQRDIASQRSDTQKDIATQRTDTQKDIEAGRETTQRDVATIRAQTSIQTTQARIADADARLATTQAAINARQDKSLQGRAATKAATDRLGMLRTQLSQAKQKLSAASASGDATQAADAQKQVDDAYARILDFQKKAGADTAAPKTGAPAAPAGGQATRGPAPASLNGKPIWPSPDGKSWVYEDGTEAK